MDLEEINIYINNSGKIFLYPNDNLPNNTATLSIVGKAWAVKFNPTKVTDIPVGMGVFSIEKIGADKQLQRIKTEYDPYNVKTGNNVVMNIIGWQIPYDNTIPIFSTEWSGLSLNVPKDTLQEKTEYIIMYLLVSDTVKFRCSNGYCIPDIEGDIYTIDECLKKCNIGIQNKPPLLGELRKDNNELEDNNENKNTRNEWILLAPVIFLTFFVLLILILLIFLKS